MDQTELRHYGVKGMKWGVRKAPETGSISGLGRDTPHTISKDGAITIPKGATVQRMVSGKTLFNSGPGLAINDHVTYAAFKGNDKLAYESNFGFTKNLLVKESSRVVTLKAKQPLKAPSQLRASEIFFESLKNDPKAMSAMRSHMDEALTYDSKVLDRALLNPRSKEALDVFGESFDGSSYNKKLKGINNTFIERLKKDGYNMIVDPSDSDFGGIYNAPIAIFNGKDNLEVASQRTVDKASKVLVKDAIKQADKIDKGKNYVDQYVFPNLK